MSSDGVGDEGAFDVQCPLAVDAPDYLEHVTKPPCLRGGYQEVDAFVARGNVAAYGHYVAS